MMEFLGTYDLNNTNGEIDQYNLSNFLLNCSNKTVDNNLYYMKVGNCYFMQGTIDFDELELDYLPEPAVCDGFISTIDGEALTIQQGQTTLTASSIGTKTVTGFYFADNEDTKDG